MTTNVDVVNRALQKIGTRTTVTSSELANASSNEAIQANLILEADRDQLLRMAPWNCSTNYVNLVYISSLPGTPENTSSNVQVWNKGLPPPPWVYEYQYPVDCLRPLKIIPQVATGFVGGVPITRAVTGGAASTWLGPAVRFEVAIDQFFPVTAATVVLPGNSYTVGEIITLATTPEGVAPQGASAQLRVETLVGSGIDTVSVVNQVSGSATALGGSYFAPQVNPVAAETSNGLGFGATFNLTFGPPVDQRVIVTNQENAIISYIRQIIDPNVMDPMFLDAWSSVLSARLAMALSGDKALANLKIAEANQSIVEARKADANEGLTVNNVTPDWLRVRGVYFPFTSGTLPGMGFDWGWSVSKLLGAQMQPKLKLAPPMVGRVFGNAEVVAFLERWLEAAKQGTIGFVAIAAIVPPKQALMDYMGDGELGPAMPFVLDRLKENVEAGMDSKALPQTDHGLDASYAAYNCCNQPVSYDFIHWLIGAEMERVREGAPGPLKVGLWRGETGNVGIEDQYRSQMFENVLRPSLALAGAVEDDAAVRGRPRGYRLREIVEGARKGEPVPKFRPSASARAAVASWFMEDEDVATITLREMDSWPHRNSNIEAWVRFAEHLEDHFYTVVFVRDTAKADVSFPGQMTCPLASVNLDVRCALYARAKRNFFVSNGPTTLALFMDCPWLMLTRHNDLSQYFPETSAWWEAHGMKFGESYPWLLPGQREVFTGDSFDEIMKAWREYEK